MLKSRYDSIGVNMYSMYSKYYDKLNKDYDFWIPFIRSQIPIGKKKEI